MDKLVGMEKFLCIWNNFNGHEILAMENFVGYVMDMWEFFLDGYFGYVGNFFIVYGYGKNLVVVYGHVKNF